MTLLLLQSQPFNLADCILGLSMLIITIAGLGYIVSLPETLRQKAEEKKEKHNKQLNLKYKHQNFILAITNNFPLFIMDYATTSNSTIQMYNPLMNSVSRKEYGVMKVCGKLVNNQYSIIASISIEGREHKLNDEQINNNVNDLSLHISNIVTTLYEKEEVQKAIILSNY